MKLGLQPLLHPISGGAGGFPLLITCHRSRLPATSAAQVDAGRPGCSYLAPAVVTARSEEKKEEEEEGGGEGGGAVTKPIIFTFLLLPASRHVILNGLSDPWAGCEPLENMVSQMKLSQETACFRQQVCRRLSPVAYYSVISE